MRKTARAKARARGAVLRPSSNDTPATDRGAKGIMIFNYSQQRPAADVLRASNLETRSKTGTGDPHPPTARRALESSEPTGTRIFISRLSSPFCQLSQHRGLATVMYPFGVEYFERWNGKPTFWFFSESGKKTYSC